MMEIDRRTFLKMGGTFVAAAVAGEYVLPARVHIDKAVEQATGHPTGNAGINQQIEDACKDNGNPKDCAQNYQFSTTDKIMGTVVAPISEEIQFRALPSAILSMTEDSDNPIGDALTGTGGLGMTRRELLVGIGSAVIFGAVHNITDKGIDTKTIPASQTVAGMVYWYLQRKFGIAANTLAHAWNNFKALT